MLAPPLDLPANPRLVANITHFARTLRRAGLPVGPGRVMDAVRAVQAVGFTSKGDFYWTLHACFVNRAEHRIVFAQVFRLFWRDPQFLEQMMSLLLPAVRGAQDPQAANPAERRAAQALLDSPPPRDDNCGDDVEIDIDASQTASDEERLRSLDFELMSNDEMARAKRLIAQMRLPVPPLLSRRTVAGHGPIADWRTTLRQSLRKGGEVSEMATKRKRIAPPNLVVMCDISGSMSQYSRVVLHFVHALMHSQTQGWGQIEGFTFGTQLTRITRHLQARDVDAALATAGAQAQDWQGGTRIAGCLHRFNQDWSRRVLGQGAAVLIVTDGLDRDSVYDLSFEMRRLSLVARQVIWLNPLLRWDGFAPKAVGVRAMLPHVTSFRAGHNIASFAGLVDALSGADLGGDKTRMLAAMRADTD